MLKINDTNSLKSDIKVKLQEFSNQDSYPISIMNCSVQDNVDLFDVNNKFLYKASDGLEYDLKEALRRRLINAQKQTKSSLSSNFFQRIFDNIKSFLGFGDSTKWFNKIIDKKFEYLDSANNIETLFKSITKLDYTKENVEMFLKDEVKLGFEIYAEDLIDEPIKTEAEAPNIDYNYSYKATFSNEEIELKDNEKVFFNNIKRALPNDYQEKFQKLLTTGKLTQEKPAQTTTILESLNKILNENRAEEIDNLVLLKECIDLLENPYLVTQHGENIPKEYENDFIKKYVESEKEMFNPNFSGNYTKDEIDLITNYRYLGTCAAASLEYSILAQNPNEFFKMIENLSSENKEYKKQISFNKNTKEELELSLTKFDVPHKFINENTCEIIIKADEDAYFLSEIQINNKDENERSICDILAQSAIMNLGSRQTYNSITDTRSANELTQDTGGLIDFEVQFIDKILLNNKDKIYKEYMTVDNNLHITQRENLNIIKNDILKALEVNKSVIIGQVFSDNNHINGGHEITIVGYEKNLNGEGFFIIQDSDDEVNKPVAIPEKELLQQIHHAMVI